MSSADAFRDREGLWLRQGRKIIALRRVIAVDGGKRFVQLQHVLVGDVVGQPLRGAGTVGIAGGGKAGPAAHHVLGKSKLGGARRIKCAADIAEISEDEKELGSVEGT